MPATIRFKHYESVEEISLENKISPAFIRIPLLDDISREIELVSI
jgi:hypothetical protein